VSTIGKDLEKLLDFCGMNLTPPFSKDELWRLRVVRRDAMDDGAARPVKTAMLGAMGFGRYRRYVRFYRLRGRLIWLGTAATVALLVLLAFEFMWPSSCHSFAIGGRIAVAGC
jgi:hypothetical protein